MGNVSLNILFPPYPLIYIWIQSGYNKCKTYQDHVDYIDECFNKSEASKNQVKKEAYYKSACVIYSKLTGMSWESMNKNIEQWANRKIN